MQQIAIPLAVTQGLQSPLAPPPPPTPGRHRIRNTEMQHAAYRKAPAVMPNAALSGSIASSLLRAPATLIARLALAAPGRGARPPGAAQRLTAPGHGAFPRLRTRDC